MVERFNNNLFISKRGDDFLVFSPKNLKVTVITEIEYLLLNCFLDNGDYDKTIQQLNNLFREKLSISADECDSILKKILKRMITADIIPEHGIAEERNNFIKYPDKVFNPISIYLHLTNKCNLKCFYCYNSDYRKRCEKKEEGELSDDEIINVIDQSCELGITSFTLTGGEPLLHSSCLEFGKYITKVKGCFVELLTNGTLLTSYSPDLLYESFSLIDISLDSHIADKHDAMRGKGTFSRIVKGLDRICKIDPDRVALRPVLHNINIDDLEDYVQWAYEEFGITRIQSSLYTPNDPFEKMELELLVNPDKFAVMMEFNENISKEGKIRLEIENLTVNKGCGAGSSILSIGAQGEVFPCQAMHSEDLLAGNIRINSLKNIGKESEVMKAVRALKPNMIEGCNDCSLLPLCGTGCRATTHGLYGSIYKRNELLCPANIKQSEFLLWKEADRYIKESNEIQLKIIQH